MLLYDIVRVSRQIGGTASRLQKVWLLAGLLNRIAPDDVATAIGLLCGEPRQGPIGFGPRAVPRALRIAKGPVAALAELDGHRCGTR